MTNGQIDVILHCLGLPPKSLAQDFRVKFTYFKSSGKYYTHETVNLNQRQVYFEILRPLEIPSYEYIKLFHEIYDAGNPLPGIKGAANQFYVLIELLDHPTFQGPWMLIPSPETSS